MTQEKTCTTCGETKGLEGFHAMKGCKFGVHSRCKVCAAEYHKKYRQENKESLAEYDKKYHQDNREAGLERNKNYQQDNRETIAARKKKYRQENRPLFRALKAKRKSRKLNATPPWLTEEHYEKIKAIYLKAQTLTEETGVPHHVDHQVPLQGKNVCGLHVPWNLDPLPASDNLKKHNTFDGGW